MATVMAPPPDRSRLVVGGRVEARDSYNKWYPSTIISIHTVDMAMGSFKLYKVKFDVGGYRSVSLTEMREPGSAPVRTPRKDKK